MTKHNVLAGQLAGVLAGIVAILLVVTSVPWETLTWGDAWSAWVVGEVAVVLVIVAAVVGLWCGLLDTRD